MAMNSRVRIDGLKELEAALADLPKATARGVLTRALRKAAKPIHDKARELVPVKTGSLRDSIVVTARTRNLTGLKEFGETLQSGGSRAEAVASLRAARRAGGSEGSRAEVTVSTSSPIRFLQEFGTIKMPANPFLTPAWEAEKDGALASVKSALRVEIDKSVARAARKAARLAAKG